MVYGFELRGQNAAKMLILGGVANDEHTAS